MWSCVTGVEGFHGPHDVADPVFNWSCVFVIYLTACNATVYYYGTLTTVTVNIASDGAYCDWPYVDFAACVLESSS